MCQKQLSSYIDAICTANNWPKNIITINGNSAGWLLTPDSSFADLVWYVDSSGDVYGGATSDARLVIPVLSINSELDIKLGSGTSTDPYQLSV